ncbi:MAG: UDP-galactopyranose mutase [Paraburkholderia sp.]|uniref:UDP-galactopyranose mutase n=1 Tax=Paraburkholderia sp. TaxID=1926495 RepID=UPI001211F5D7|nr:UDP-galactopyranose mutase [Paraburkholderia sp.]TAM03960.1 MAG: UDP-galactopyranose mutase [Paraburkholderia sp.]TAM31947.1 MAG: UDP-galactopyranose mutase [Paraburkholderia sp.]
MKYDFVIVGAGFAGAVCAERLATGGQRVLVIDRRDHIGGNAFDRTDEHGVLIHPYGPHIFHTGSRRIFEYLSRFTDWRFYEHRVQAHIDGNLYPIPINRTTINTLYNLDLNEQETADYLASVREARERLTTSEDVVLSSVGRDLCERFFRGYTLKQWGLDLSELSAGVAARIPTRTNDDDRYFTDAFQFMPAQGYTTMFGRMLDHPNIEVRLSTDFLLLRSIIEYDRVVYTGPIDAYFDYRFGKLPYRSLSFQHIHLSGVEHFQSSGTVNYPNDHEYTRITEFKHLTGQKHPGTSIVKEYPRSDGEPYYPIPRPENEALFQRYNELAEATPNVTFVGRLAQYRYYNMDQVVGAALKAVETLL